MCEKKKQSIIIKLSQRNSPQGEPGPGDLKPVISPRTKTAHTPLLVSHQGCHYARYKPCIIAGGGGGCLGMKGCVKTAGVISVLGGEGWGTQEGGSD